MTKYSHTNNDLVDTHCHIHDPEFNEKYNQTPDELVLSAQKKGVRQLICVGTTLRSSILAVKFANSQANVYSSLALHPHEVASYTLIELEKQLEKIDEIIIKDKKSNKKSNKKSSIVAIGECGLDYFYHDNPETHQRQEKLLRLHLNLAKKHDLPVIFHIRSARNDNNTPEKAFSRFSKILDEYKDIRGVVHSFSAGIKELEVSLERGLYIGLNGIITFTKDAGQLEAIRSVPLNKMVLETDAPFLTPVPFRGNMCKPEHTRVTAEFISKIRCESPEEVASVTTNNAQKLFKL